MTHYAISELLIVVAGTWAVQRMFKNNHRAAALGILLFILVAAIGVVRFGFDRDGSLIAGLADIHRIAGTFGGTAAMMCLVYDVLGRRAVWVTWQNWYLAVVVIGLAVAIAVPGLIVPIFALWSLGFIWLVSRAAPTLEYPTVQAVAIAGLMLFNVLVFRQSPYLAPAVGWHIFHVLVAVWLIGLGFLLQVGPPRGAVKSNERRI